MPSQTGSDVLFASMPTFKYIFKEKPIPVESRKAGEDAPTSVNPGRRALGPFVEPHSRKQLSDRSFPTLHQYRGSVSTSASDSTNSSPTTTFSATDSSVMTEPSPGTSPESPASKSREIASCSSDHTKSDKSVDGSGGSTFFELQRPATPSKRPRNLKNLAVNTSNSFLLNRAVTTAAITTVSKADSAISAPSSPSFVKPLTPPRRRPSNLGLTIQTPANTSKASADSGLVVPPTPGFKRPNTLRHFQSSPSLPLRSPSSDGSEVNGNIKGSIIGHPATRGFSEIPQESEEDEEVNYDIPQSREEKPASYPDGPICIYEPGVYLYFEPTANEASGYDVILNVASEVKNPFASSKAADQAAPLPLGYSKSPQFITLLKDEPQTTQPENGKAFSTCRKRLSDLTVKEPPQVPEYVHIPWEHNTDIVPDLYRLVRLIDERVQLKKKVLVHCQCGVSRSASLIVAYGLYKNPHMSVQEAYDAVKKRSKWIGPNMNLIMQLQEFRSELLRNANEKKHTNNIDSTYAKFFTHRKNLKSESSAKISNDGSSSLDSGTYRPEPQSPHTAPLPPSSDIDDESTRAEFPAPASAGPSSAPLSSPWMSSPRRAWAASPKESETMLPPFRSGAEMQYVDPKGQILGGFATLNALAQPRSIKDKQKQGHRNAASTKVDSAVGSDAETQDDVQISPSETDSFSVASPTASSFPMTLPSRASTTEAAGTSTNAVTKASSNTVSRPATTSALETDGLLSPTRAEFPALPFGFTRAQNEIRASARPEVVARAPKISVVGSTTDGERTDNERCLSPSMLDSLSLESPRGSKMNLIEPKKHRELRTKYSSPGLHEQMQLRRLQDEIEANLTSGIAPRSGQIAIGGSDANNNNDEVLMSPRATEFTSNPFHDILAPPLATSIPPSPISISSISPAFVKRAESGLVTSNVEPNLEDGKLSTAPCSKLLPIQTALLSSSSPSSAITTCVSDSNGHGNGNDKDNVEKPTVSENDPRSPVQKGLSPIMRNIWDVL